MALSARYGFHRDELCFLACARHLQASHVDQPLLTPLLAPLLARASLFAVSLPGLRVWPALAAWATLAATLSNPYGIHNQEWGGHVCAAPPTVGPAVREARMCSACRGMRPVDELAYLAGDGLPSGHARNARPAGRSQSTAARRSRRPALHWPTPVVSAR